MSFDYKKYIAEGGVEAKMEAKKYSPLAERNYSPLAETELEEGVFDFLKKAKETEPLVEPKKKVQHKIPDYLAQIGSRGIGSLANVDTVIYYPDFEKFQKEKNGISGITGLKELSNAGAKFVGISKGNFDEIYKKQAADPLKQTLWSLDMGVFYGNAKKKAKFIFPNDTKRFNAGEEALVIPMV